MAGDKTDTWAAFDAIRKHYAERAHLIVNASDWDLDPYEWDTPKSGIRLTPIEAAVWEELRNQDVVMYPQYPVGRYFVDFGNPVAKVAIECDGAAWHKDVEKDSRRQSEIVSMGWRMYRIGGRDCLATDGDGIKRAVAEFVKNVCWTNSIKFGGGLDR